MLSYLKSFKRISHWDQDLYPLRSWCIKWIGESSLEIYLDTQVLILIEPYSESLLSFRFLERGMGGKMKDPGNEVDVDHSKGKPHLNLLVRTTGPILSTSHILRRSVCLSLFLSFSLSVCLSAYLSACLSVCHSVCLSACLPTSLFISVCLQEVDQFITFVYELSFC